MLIKHILLVFSAFFFLGLNGAKIPKFYPKSQLHLGFSLEPKLSGTPSVLPTVSPAYPEPMDKVFLGGSIVSPEVSCREISKIFNFSFRDDYLNDGWQFQFEGWTNLKDTHHHRQFLLNLGLFYFDIRFFSLKDQVLAAKLSFITKLQFMHPSRHKKLILQLLLGLTAEEIQSADNNALMLAFGNYGNAENNISVFSQSFIDNNLPFIANAGMAQFSARIISIFGRDNRGIRREFFSKSVAMPKSFCYSRYSIVVPDIYIVKHHNINTKKYSGGTKPMFFDAIINFEYSKSHYAVLYNACLRLSSLFWVGAIESNNKSNLYADLPMYEPTSYEIWSRRFLSHLNEHAAQIIDPIDPLPRDIVEDATHDADAVQEHATQWDKSNRKLFRSIHHCVFRSNDQNAISIVESVENLNGITAWKALRAFHCSDTLQNKASILMELLTLTQLDNESLMSYRLQSMCIRAYNC